MFNNTSSNYILQSSYEFTNSFILNNSFEMFFEIKESNNDEKNTGLVEINEIDNIEKNKEDFFNFSNDLIFCEVKQLSENIFENYRDINNYDNCEKSIDKLNINHIINNNTNNFDDSNVYPNFKDPFSISIPNLKGSSSSKSQTEINDRNLMNGTEEKGPEEIKTNSKKRKSGADQKDEKRKQKNIKTAKEHRERTKIKFSHSVEENTKVTELGLCVLKKAYIFNCQMNEIPYVTYANYETENMEAMNVHLKNISIFLNCHFNKMGFKSLIKDEIFQSKIEEFKKICNEVDVESKKIKNNKGSCTKEELKKAKSRLIQKKFRAKRSYELNMNNSIREKIKNIGECLIYNGTCERNIINNKQKKSPLEKNTHNLIMDHLIQIGNIINQY